jgi:RNA polymerase sigma-70 factor (ECF subfamily)
VAKPAVGRSAPGLCAGGLGSVRLEAAPRPARHADEPIVPTAARVNRSTELMRLTVVEFTADGMAAESAGADAELDAPDGSAEPEELDELGAPEPVVRLRAVEPFDVFYRRELPAVLALARALCGAATAEDVAQEAMLAAYRHWGRVSVMDRPDAWVRRVTVNIATSRLRRRGSETRALLRLSARPVVVVELPERDEAFWAAVRRLPRRQAQVVSLHYVEDLGVTATAELLGVSAGAVKQYLFRARQALAKELGAREVES